MATKTKNKALTIKLFRGTAKADTRQMKVLVALGLRKSQDVVQHDDSAVIRGMLRKVAHLVTVSENK